MSKWSVDYINRLPDEAFAVIEPAYLKGEIKDKRCRHLPHHTPEVKNGKENDHIDISHLRNAWQRRHQIMPVTDSITVDELRRKAEEHLKRHIEQLDLNWSENTLVLGALKLGADKGYIQLTSPLELPPGNRPMQFQLNSNSEDLIPKDEDWIYPSFRALSAVYIEAYAIDFSDEEVLRRAVPLLKGQTVYPDHDVRIEKWLGKVVDTWWVDGKEGMPPGINAKLAIDWKTNPKIARGILAGAIHSASVTVFFKWVKSHPEMGDIEFLFSLGEERDGEVVRVVVTEITGFGELSLVWQGADPFAKKLEGEMNEVEKLKAELLKKEEEIEELRKRLHDKEQLAALGQKFLQQLREETKKVYIQLRGSEASEQILALIDDPSTSITTLEALRLEYERELRQQLSITCPNCGYQFSPPGIRSSIEVPVKEPEPKVDPKIFRVR